MDREYIRKLEISEMVIAAREALNSPRVAVRNAAQGILDRYDNATNSVSCGELEIMRRAIHGDDRGVTRRILRHMIDCGGSVTHENVWKSVSGLSRYFTHFGYMKRAGYVTSQRTTGSGKMVYDITLKGRLYADLG